MTAPARRVWLFPVRGALEIVVLGHIDETAPVIERVLRACETDAAFSRVDVLLKNGAPIGVRVTGAPGVIPIASATIVMIGAVPGISWSGHECCGVVGTW